MQVTMKAASQTFRNQSQFYAYLAYDLFISKWAPAPIECPAETPTVLMFEAFYIF